MSEAENLLNDLTETEVDHKHIVPDSDTYFRIDPNTRQIENTSYNKTVLMCGDHNSERFTFELPRYVDGHDMSLCNRVIVHFDNVGASIENAHHDVAYMDDLRVNPDNPDTVISSWLIRREATQIVGILSFAIQYLCVEGDDITYEWKTDSYDEIEIRQSKNNGEAATIQYHNVLEQWRSQLFGAGDSVMSNINTEGTAQVNAVKNESATQQAAIELKAAETLATIPADYTEVYNMATEAIRTKADGIVCGAEGSVIAINDASDDYIRGLNVYGKSTQFTTTGAQLAYIPDVESYENNGVVWSSNGGIITAKGNAPIHSYTPSNIHADLKGLVGTFYLSGNGKYIKVAVQYTRDGVTNYVNSPQEFTLDGTETRVELYCQITTYNTDIDDTAYPMVNVGNTALPYEPYTGGMPAPNPEYPQEIVSAAKPTVNVCGKNLLETSGVTETINGVTFTANKDGSILVSGTATANAYYVVKRNIPLVPGERYTLTGCPSDGSQVTYLLYHRNNVTGIDYYDTGSGCTFLATSDKGNIVIAVYKGATVNSEVFYPMVRHASISDATFEPYKPAQTITLPHTLHGLPVTESGNYTDENGQQWICDEVDLERGVYVKRLYNDHPDFSSATVTGTSSGYTEGRVYAHTRFIKNGLSDQFIYSQGGSAKERFAVLDDGAMYFTIKGEYTVDEWCAKMNSISPHVLVQLATPIETPLTAEEITAYRALKTNYPNTTILNDSGAWMTAKYNADTLIFLRDNQPKPTDEQVQTAVNAYVEANAFNVDADGNATFAGNVTASTFEWYGNSSTEPLAYVEAFGDDSNPELWFMGNSDQAVSLKNVENLDVAGELRVKDCLMLGNFPDPNHPNEAWYADRVYLEADGTRARPILRVTNTYDDSLVDINVGDIYSGNIELSNGLDGCGIKLEAGYTNGTTGSPILYMLETENDGFVDLKVENIDVRGGVSTSILHLIDPSTDMGVNLEGYSAPGGGYKLDFFGSGADESVDLGNIRDINMEGGINAQGHITGSYITIVDPNLQTGVYISGDYYNGNPYLEFFGSECDEYVDLRNVQNLYAHRDVYAQALVLTSPNGSKFRITVDDNGELSTAPVTE